METKPNEARPAVTPQAAQSSPGYVLNYNLLALAMGFVPDQVWQNIYQEDAVSCD